MTEHTRIREAYLQMAKRGRYRPPAPKRLLTKTGWVLKLIVGQLNGAPFVAG